MLVFLEIVGSCSKGSSVVELNFVDHSAFFFLIVLLVDYQRNPVVKRALPYLQLNCTIELQHFNFLPIPEHTFVEIPPFYSQSRTTLHSSVSKPMRHLRVVAKLPKKSTGDWLPAHIYFLNLFTPQSRLVYFLFGQSLVEYWLPSLSLRPLLIITHISPTL